MGGFVNSVRKALLDNYFGKSTLTPPDNLYVGLSSTTPAADGSGFTEPSGGGYARVQTSPADWNAATEANPAVLDNASAVTFPTATGNWAAGANLTHAGLFTAASGGTPVAWGALATAKPALEGDTTEYPAGTIDVTMAGA